MKVLLISENRTTTLVSPFPDLVTLKAGIRIYPGTQLETLAGDEGMIENDHDLLHPAFYLSTAIREWVWDYLGKTVAKHGNWKI